jgi:hypothetical protein
MAQEPDQFTVQCTSGAWLMARLSLPRGTNALELREAGQPVFNVKRLLHDAQAAYIGARDGCALTTQRTPLRMSCNPDRAVLRQAWRSLTTCIPV